MNKAGWKIGVAVAAVTGVGFFAVRALRAEQPLFQRVQLQKNDLGMAGREAVMVRGEFAPGGSVAKHTHPGDEVSYVLEGTLELDIDGRVTTLEAGKSFFIPVGTVHSAKNKGTGVTKVLSTYIVEKGKPLATMK
jgi:quercetin dioxygenase-like cupin family protein